MAPVSLRARAAAIAAAAVTCVGLIGLTLSVRQGARSEMLGYSYSNMPGAFGPAYGVSPPSVKFHVTQQLPTGPHPMTTDALVTSNNAISFAQAVGNTEREDKQRLEDTEDNLDAVKTKTSDNMQTSRIAIWKEIGMLRKKIMGYRNRLVNLKGQMMSRDNYLDTRMNTFKNAIGRSEVSMERRMNDMHIRMAVVASQSGPKGSPGPDGFSGKPGAQGYPGLRGDRGQPGVIGVTGPRGFDGRDGIPGGLGPKGDMGLPGATGPGGPSGISGRRGPMGLYGIAGAGHQGARGPPGPAGPPGYAGVAGPSGPTGQSIPGQRGLPGTAGDRKSVV